MVTYFKFLLFINHYYLILFVQSAIITNLNVSAYFCSMWFSFLPTFAESVIGIPAEFYEEIKSELIAPNKEG